MELIFNELSFLPLSDNVSQVEQRFKILLNTFKEANSKYGFKKIRFAVNLSSQQLTAEMKFVQVVGDFTNKDLKRAVLTFLNPPYLDDLTVNEMETFYKSEYKLVGDDCPTKETPFGLPVAHIKSFPVISLDSHEFWKASFIEVLAINDVNELLFKVPNVCAEQSLDSEEMKEWAEISISKIIASKEQLIKFLGFIKLEANISDYFFEQLMNWKNNEYKMYKYILSLMKDVELHPFSGGMGRTENLKGRGKEASKRITNRYPDGDRLSYAIEKDIVSFISCKGHYNFH